jgi:GxxExxY protein
MELEAVAAVVVDAALTVHRALGPGLLESAYQQCLVYELRKRGLRVLTEVTLPIIYDGKEIDAAYRLDMLIEDVIIIENKAVDHVLPVHMAQLITYLRLTNLRLGFLINWNVKLIKDGLKRVANNL